MDTPNQTKILLESGTNELEIMEFTVGGELFGINIAKIREIMRAQETKRMPNSHNFVEGIFKQRGEVITVIDLAKCLNIERTENKSHDIFILTHFNKLNFAFRVESVVGIDRVSWEDIKKPDKVIYSGEDSVATAIAEYKDRLITILDFEKIIADISPETSITLDRLDELGDRVESQKKILVAEDSMMLSNLIIGFLHKSGYKNTVKFNNGKEAWDYLTEAKNSGLPISNYASCIVSDIEMPLMDGHRLTKLVKSDEKLKDIPVILFSSLISDELRIKGKEVGADEQITKPEIVELVNIIDRLI
ncbi:MAG: chemotaxis protein [Romboutsia timonensis]|uniref:chemotaxis protein n=1 Tax=Romboutsia timonensis TaxID=1776391 RepID=UPI002A763A42|nr:chemotaxis protein [Romboutsia timonensis]MDY3000891.1 chemotaxis protein [Romboutsia timonensis]